MPEKGDEEKTYGVWICFDLAVGGDYDGLYFWLDKHEAKECGVGVAFLAWDYREDWRKELEESLKQSVKLTERDRIYIVGPHPKLGTAGQFMAGGRGVPPWSGYAKKEEVGIDGVNGRS